MPGVLVLHTTESKRLRPAVDWMVKQRTMAHRCFDPATGERAQMLPWGQPAKSLKNLPGGVETNKRGAVYQLEIVGEAAKVTTYSDDWYRVLAAEVTSICGELHVPLEFPCEFVAYPQSYGARNGVRLAGPVWQRVAGIIGHQHVPESDHGDPGDLSRLRRFVVGGGNPGGDMAVVGKPVAPDEMARLREIEQVLADQGFLHRGPAGLIDEDLRVAIHELKNYKVVQETEVVGLKVEIEELRAQLKAGGLDAETIRRLTVVLQSNQWCADELGLITGVSQ